MVKKVELTLQSGETLQADVVIYGIGISANDQLAREANLDTTNGIVIDEACRTCDPAIFAGGDVAITRLDNGALHRCESWENANNQGANCRCRNVRATASATVAAVVLERSVQ